MIEYHWPTPIGIYDVGTPELNAGIVEAAATTQKIASFWELDAHPAVRELRNLFARTAEELMLKREPNSKYQIMVGQAWCNVYQPYDWQTPHAHGNVVLVGVYYVRAKPNCGDLLLQDPAAGSVWTNYSDGPFTSRTYTRFQVKESRMILFPGHIVHCTDVNRSGDLRISVAAFLGMKKQ